MALFNALIGDGSGTTGEGPPLWVVGVKAGSVGAEVQADLAARATASKGAKAARFEALGVLCAAAAHGSVST